MASFESVADAYDTARPDHPPGVYEALGELAGLVVLDVGAGTGIAARRLLERGAQVVAVDRGAHVLGHAVARTPGMRAVVADGSALPVPDAVSDLACFAQSWHWLDPATRVREVHRVLRAGGRWAAWWSHARADDDAWFQDHWAAVEVVCPGTNREQRDVDWGATVVAGGRFDVGARIVVPWTRELTIATWLTDMMSHSYVAALDPADRDRLVAEIERIAIRRFPSRAMQVPYETWLWIATKV